MNRASGVQVKICGLTRLEDALAAIRWGVDALGFVFAESKRRIDASVAQAIIQALPSFVTTVGVFMNQPREEVREIARRLQLDRVQLHGSETPDDCRAMECPVIKRISVTPDDDSETLQTQMNRFNVSGFILDPGAGDGRPFSWEAAAGLNSPFILAGGLHPGNVKAAILAAQPAAVDVSSGVEFAPGIKDRDKMKRFIQEAKWR